MLQEESQRRQTELREYLQEMSTTCMSDEYIRVIAAKLKTLYTDGFRHSYSDLFPLIVSIAKNPNCSLEYLANNLQSVHTLVEQDYVDKKNEFAGLYSHLRKLSDHLNLEIARYNYYFLDSQVDALQRQNEFLQNELRKASDTLSVAQEKVSSVYEGLETATQQLKAVRESVESAKGELSSAKDVLGKANERIGSMQTELVSVLSIFAAIVLTFSGSMSLLGSALTGMQETPFYKATFFVLLCGFILCNSIFLMMYIIGKITNRNIYARCKSPDCSCGSDGSPMCKGIHRVRKRLPYVFWLNVSIIVLMVADVALWVLSELELLGIPSL